MKKQLKDLTFVIKVFDRHDCVTKLVSSIKKFYYEPHILIVDDGFKPFNADGLDVRYIRLPVDVGLSAGRNLAVKNVETEYFVLLDDDFLFTSDTKVELLLELVKSDKFDIVAGLVSDFGVKTRHYYGTYEIDNKTLTLNLRTNSGIVNKFKMYDFVPNFFCARKNISKNITWDNEIKIHREHDDYFLKCKEKKLRITLLKNVVVEHYPTTTKHYEKYRKRALEYENYFNKKYDINQRVIKGRTYSALEYIKALITKEIFSKRIYISLYNKILNKSVVK